MSTHFFLPRGLLQSVLLILILSFLILSCSHNTSPVDPGIADAPPGGSTVIQTSSDPLKACWGIWDVYMDYSGDFITVPLRDVMYTVNVNQYLQPPYGNLANMHVVITDESQLMSQGRVSVNVTLSHPFPDYDEYCGFDVLGVFINKGNETAKHDDDIKYASPGDNAILENSDGYTRWMNQVEFTASGIGGYTEGALGDKNAIWTATVNPFKYFCDGLGSTESIRDHYALTGSVANRGVFKAGASNTRKYDIVFPMVGGYPSARFQYAVVASWAEPVKTPPTNLPGDFPYNANLVEPFAALADIDGSTVYYNSSSDNGGDLLLTLEIFCQGARTDPDSVEGQIDEITVESPDGFIPGSSGIEFGSADWTTAPGSTQISQRFILDCGTVDPQGPDPDDNRIFISIRSQTGSWDTAVGTPHPTGRAKYFQVFGIPMTQWSPDAPGLVQNFEASDADPSLSSHRVELTWDLEPDADNYELEKYDYDLDGEYWSWIFLNTVGSSTTSYIDSNARYCGNENPIEYRIRATNSFGNSPGWSKDTGYPKLRDVGITFWCAANDLSGNNAVVPWSRAVADFTDCNNFWNPYGFNMVMENDGEFFWMTNPGYRQLSGTEDQQMHEAFGQQNPHWDYINVYYVESAFGDTSRAYDVAICPGSDHSTMNTFIVICRDARYSCPSSQEIPIILAHEMGHALPRFWDIYLIVTSCANDNTWCSGPPPYTPVMYCDDDARYLGNLMYYSVCNAPVSFYDLTVGEYIFASERIRSLEGNYPTP